MEVVSILGQRFLEPSCGLPSPAPALPVKGIQNPISGSWKAGPPMFEKSSVNIPCYNEIQSYEVVIFMCHKLVGYWQFHEFNLIVPGIQMAPKKRNQYKPNIYIPYVSLSLPGGGSQEKVK